MHQTARMINKTHSLLFGQSRTVASRNKGHPQRVRCRPYRPLEHSIEPLIDFSCQPRDRTIPRPEWKEDFFQLLGHRNRKQFLWIIRFPFRVLNPEDHFLKIDPICWNTGLRETTTDMSHDLEDNAHPRRFIGKGLPGLYHHAIGKLRLFRGCLPLDFRLSQSVALTVFAANSLIQNEREKFQLQTRRVVHRGGLSPMHKVLSVLIPNLARVLKIAKIEPLANRFPGSGHPLMSARTLVVARNIVRNPCAKFARIVGRNLRLLDGVLLRQPPRVSRLLRIVMAQLSRLLAPSAGFEITISEIPVGRTLVFPQRGHARSVPHSPTYLKWPIVVYRGVFSVKLGEQCATSTYRYTTRQSRRRHSITYRRTSEDRNLSSKSWCFSEANQGFFRPGLWHRPRESGLFWFGCTMASVHLTR